MTSSVTSACAEKIAVRPANAGDLSIIYQMLRESATAQGGEKDLCVNPVNLLEDGFGPGAPRFMCLLAEVEGQAAGLVLYYFVYSTWTSRSGLYLEDLYVSPGFRSRGVARALMAKLANVAIEAGSLHMRWLALKGNIAAVKLYEGLGAKHASEWSPMHLEREDLTKLARSAASNPTE